MTNNTQTTMPKWTSAVIQRMNQHDIINSYFGSCNLTAEFLNDYSPEAQTEFVGDFLEDATTSGQELPFSFRDAISEPDTILQHVSSEFATALGRASNNEDLDNLMRIAKWDLSSGSSTFWIFGEQWSNSCCNYWIVSADTIQEAYEILTDVWFPECNEDEDELMGDIMLAGVIVPDAK